MSTWQPLAESLVRERYRALVGYAYLLTAHMGDAEDAVQEAIVATFSRRARFTNVGQAEAYVRRAIASRVIDERRSRARRVGRETRFDVLWEHDGHDGPVALHVDVATALAALSPRVRACIALRFMADQSTAQTAHALGLSEGAVKRYVSDGVAQLGRALGTVASDEDSVDVQAHGGVR
jgi:RNA polymerase sigma factor (sigma-70 family)